MKQQQQGGRQLGNANRRVHESACHSRSTRPYHDIQQRSNLELIEIASKCSHSKLHQDEVAMVFAKVILQASTDGTSGDDREEEVHEATMTLRRITAIQISEILQGRKPSKRNKKKNTALVDDVAARKVRTILDYIRPFDQKVGPTIPKSFRHMIKSLEDVLDSMDWLLTKNYGLPERTNTIMYFDKLSKIGLDMSNWRNLSSKAQQSYSLHELAVIQQKWSTKLSTIYFDLVRESQKDRNLEIQ